jgi:hypothetical protein
MHAGVEFRVDTTAPRVVQAELYGFRRLLTRGADWTCPNHAAETVLQVDLRADHPATPEFVIVESCCPDWSRTARRRLVELLADFIDATRMGTR